MMLEVVFSELEKKQVLESYTEVKCLCFLNPLLVFMKIYLGNESMHGIIAVLVADSQPVHREFR